MIDMGATIAPKSDQLNSDDLISGPRTIRITQVKACPDSAEQPIAVYFEGDNGKPFKPCKSMRRVMVQVWGRDGAAYVGRSLRLYRDPDVAFGGMKVGGSRISHMSHIESAVTMALTATRASKKAFTVKPMPTAQPRQVAKADDAAPFTRADGQEGYDIGGHDPEMGEVDDGPDRRLMVVKRIVDAIWATQTLEDLDAVAKAERLTVKSLPEEMQAEIKAKAAERRVDLAGGE